MTAGLLAATTLVAVALLLWLPLRWAFGGFVAALVLVPDTMAFPFVSNQLLLVRVLPLAFLGGLLLRVGRGEVRGDAFRPSLATIGLIGFGVVAWIVGVLGADATVPPTFSRDSWVLLPEQVVVLVAATAAARTIGSVRAALAVATVATTAAVVAIVERITGQGYAELLFRHLPDQRAGAGGRLELRAGEVRPRVATRFSLAYAWQATMFLPVVTAAAVAARRRWRFAAVPLLVLAIAFTSSRSAYLGIAAGLAVFALLSRRRTVIVTIAAMAVVGALAVTASGLAGNAFDAPEAQGSTAIREERAPVVLAAVADDPFTGLGYGALLSRGLPGTDSSWLQLYAELGAVGVAALALSVVMALAAIGPALSGTAHVSPERVVAAGCWAGVALSLLGAAYFDLFTGRQSVLALWAMAAVGVTAAEELRPGHAPALRSYVTWPLLPVVGLVVGSAVLLVGPRPAVTATDLQLLPAATDAAAGGPGTFVGRTLGRTACSILTEAVDAAGAAASCVLPLGRGQGEVSLRVTSRSEPTTRRATEAALDALARRLPGAEVLHLDVVPRSLPAPVRTAPLSGAAAGTALALLLPTERRSRARPLVRPSAAR